MTKTLIAFLGLLLPLLARAEAKDHNGTATLMIMVDDTDSIKNDRRKAALLAPIIEDAMEKSQCKFQVSVGSLAFKGLTNYFYLKPWGDPAFIDENVENGPDIIAQRILNPRISYKEAIQSNTVKESRDRMKTAEDTTGNFPSNNSEITYSSAYETLKYNYDKIKDSKVIGTIIFSDAVPAFELYSPKDAADKIKELLGETPYISAIVGPDLFAGMKVGETNIGDCGPDYPSEQQEGLPINASTWDSPNIEGINQFTNEIWGHRWNICEPRYDEKFIQFVYELLAMGECLDMT